MLDNPPSLLTRVPIVTNNRVGKKRMGERTMDELKPNQSTWRKAWDVIRPWNHPKGRNRNLAALIDTGRVLVIGVPVLLVLAAANDGLKSVGFNLAGEWDAASRSREKTYGDSLPSLMSALTVAAIVVIGFGFGTIWAAAAKYLREKPKDDTAKPPAP